MYSRRQRSTRNAAATTNANAAANARTTRGRTNKAKHPRRGGGNPDTARVRASIGMPAVVPWVKVLRPPALHLRRTFLVEKWVRPSDLTAAERGVYDAEQKEKEEERQRRMVLKLQQQKREQEEKEKARNEQQQREREQKETETEKERSLLAAAAATAAVAVAVETANNEISVVEKLVSDKPTAAAIVSTATAETPVAATTTAAAATTAAATATTAATTTTTIMATNVPATTQNNETIQSEVAKAVPTTSESEQTTQAPSGGGGADAFSTTPAAIPPMPQTQLSSEQTQLVSLTQTTEGKPTTPLVVVPESSSTSTLVGNNTDPNLQGQKHQQALPQTNESEPKEAPQQNSSTTVSLSVTKPLAEEQQQPKQQEENQQRSSDAEDAQLSTEPLAKKARVE